MKLRKWKFDMKILIAFEKYAKIWEEEIGITFKAANVGCMMPYIDYTPRTFEEIKKAKGWG